MTPFIGDETEIRNPAPSTSRLIFDETSIEGWIVPDEGILRFPVYIESDAVLRCRFGVQGDFSQDNLTGRITIECRQGGFIAELYSQDLDHSVYPLTEPIDIYAYLNCAPGECEIIFTVSGQINESPDLSLFWGAPVVFYPDVTNNRNILLVGIDALRADGLSVYGGRSIVSPNIREFSEDSTIFDQARAQSSWTLPSFASIITGQLPSTIGSTLFSGRVSANAVTLGEHLRPYGYATGTVCGNTYLGNRQSGFHQGMDELWFRFSATPDPTANAAIDFIERNSDRDWCLFLHFMDPHGPYTPSDEFAELTVNPDYTGSIGNAFHLADQWKDSPVRPPDQDIERARDLYDAEIASVDSAFRRVIDYLESIGQLDKTLIIITADHGEEFYEHDGFEHGHTHYDEMVKVPFIIRGPGFQSGTRVDTCVGNTDIVPTILDFLKVPIPEELPGIPLQNINEYEESNNRFIFGEGNNRGTHRKFVVQWPYKCILDYVTGDFRLYNLETDPGETTDVSSEDPEITTNLMQVMSAMMVSEDPKFHVWFMGGADEPPVTFNGTIEVSPGLENVRTFGLEETDLLNVNENTIEFSITNNVPVMGLDKHLTIFPGHDDVSLEVTVNIEGEVFNDLFFPYGNMEPEVSGHAVLTLDDYPLGPQMPSGQVKLPPGMYIWGVRGYDREQISTDFDPETLEQLRSLGYI